MGLSNAYITLATHYEHSCTRQSIGEFPDLIAILEGVILSNTVIEHHKTFVRHIANISHSIYKTNKRSLAWNYRTLINTHNRLTQVMTEAHNQMITALTRASADAPSPHHKDLLQLCDAFAALYHHSHAADEPSRLVHFMADQLSINLKQLIITATTRWKSLTEALAQYRSHHAKGTGSDSGICVINPDTSGLSSPSIEPHPLHVPLRDMLRVLHKAMDGHDYALAAPSARVLQPKLDAYEADYRYHVGEEDGLFIFAYFLMKIFDAAAQEPAYVAPTLENSAIWEQRILNALLREPERSLKKALCDPCIEQYFPGLFSSANTEISHADCNAPAQLA
ncbi:MAG: hypothetical protein COB66_03000 [Coxiella sp. (in: Bacteria)]|nr:MAG: hypothetical protein COB66_03000 [Coxiella sp. (in: g-proteobacteria)]